ncbi:MAG: hypothetical protein FJ348_03190 [Sphingomonadales bacterium]|nr:hypothetical protein [Sphingomonadales bacterium]
MNLAYTHLLPSDFSATSRVWIYQAPRLFSLAEAFAIEDRIDQFTAQWQSHGQPVKGKGFLFFGQFIVLLADQTATMVSGCSTDSSVALIKKLEQEFSTSLLDRTQLAFVVGDKIERLPLAQIDYALEKGFITATTLYFNNTVATKEELEKNWIVPVSQSWLSKRLTRQGGLSGTEQVRDR